MVGFLLVVQVPNARDKRFMALLARPVYRSVLRPGGVQRMVGAILDYVALDGRAFRPTFGPRFDEDVRHNLAPSCASFAVNAWPVSNGRRLQHLAAFGLT
jgi:hypothetical protein